MPATLTVVRDGQERGEILVALDRAPLQLRFERGAGGNRIRFERQYMGSTVQSILFAERIVRILDGGSYIGILGKEGELFSDTQPRPLNPDATWLNQVFEMLSELSERSGWDLRLSEHVDWAELAEAESLLELFRTGRRTLQGECSFPILIEGQESLAAVKRILRSGREISIEGVRPNQRVVSLFGEERLLPPVELHPARAVVSQETRERVLSSTDLPLSFEVEVPEHTEIVEALLDPPLTDQLAAGPLPVPSHRD
jgi:hypothetical protein